MLVHASLVLYPFHDNYMTTNLVPRSNHRDFMTGSALLSCLNLANFDRYASLSLIILLIEPQTKVFTSMKSEVVIRHNVLNMERACVIVSLYPSTIFKKFFERLIFFREFYSLISEYGEI